MWRGHRIRTCHLLQTPKVMPVTQLNLCWKRFSNHKQKAIDQDRDLLALLLVRWGDYTDSGARTVGKETIKAMDSLSLKNNCPSLLGIRYLMN
jgi:hypothetical protein